METNSNAPKVLVIDDNEQNRELVRATLQDEGMQVIAAGDGPAGIDAFAADGPDCVLLDVRMPGMDGFTVCKALRALPNGGATPIVFLTGQRDVETFDRAVLAGGDDFLTKPVQPTELLVRVQAALKLGRLTAALRETYEVVRKQRDELMRAQIQKEQLTEYIVHDLKNPVGTVDLHALLLLRDQELPARARDSLERMRSELRSLLRMLLNLLDIGRGDEGKLLVTKTEIALGELFAELSAAFEVKARMAGVTLASSLATPSVMADRDLLRRVLENLIDNAIRHAPEGSTVEVQASATDGAVEIRVRDEGRGVPAELRERVFERFVQLEHKDGFVSRAGRGLGLAFCRIAVRAHGGSLTVEDSDKGASLLVRLPA